MSLLYPLPIGTLLSPTETGDCMITPYLRSNLTPAGWKCSMAWNCGCAVLFYTPPQIPTDPNRMDNSSCCIPLSNPPCITDDFSIQERRVCGGHQRPGFLSFNMPPGRTFNYTCKTCGYYLTDEEHFHCELEQTEYHPEVHAAEYFGGFCEGVSSCVICDTTIPYDEVYKLYVDYLGELRAEAAAEDREEDFNY